MSKTAQVFTNDARQAPAKLTISGPVKSFAKIHPKRVRLSGYAGSEIKSMVRITPSEEYPFRITDVTLKHGVNIEYNLKEAASPDGPTYLLAIENRKETPGRYSDVIFLKTDHTLKPQLKINVFGNVAPVKK